MLFIAAILAMASPADGVAKARQAYSSCLSSFTNDAMDKKMTSDEFKAALKPKCAAKEAEFRSAIAAADKSYGMTDAETTADADSQVAEYIDKMTDDFQDFLAHGR